MSINELWQDLLNYLNTQQLGHLRPRNFNTYVNDIQTQLQRDLFEEYQKTQTISDSLRPFLISKNVVSTQDKTIPYTLIKYPSDYEYYVAARITVSGGETCLCGDSEDPECDSYKDPDESALKREKIIDSVKQSQIELVPTGRWTGVQQHRKKMPTFKNPKMTQVSGGFKLLPANIAIIQLDYFRKPNTAMFAFTTDPETDQIIYNKTDSVDLEWPDNVRHYFIKEIMKKHSTFVKDEFTFQASSQNSSI